jgi:hypothetical protein
VSGPYLGRDGAFRCASGESVTLRLSIKSAAGALVDLTGRAFRWRVLSAAGEELASVDGVVEASVAVFAMPGTTTDDLTGSGIRYEVIELVAAGRREWLSGLFVARAGGPFVSGSGQGGSVAAMVDERGAVVIQAVGAPGLTAWEAAGQTLAEYEAERVDGPVAAAVGIAAATTAATEAERLATEATRIATDAARVNAEGVVAAGAETLALRDATLIAADRAEDAAAGVESITATYTIAPSTDWAAKIAVFAGGEVLAGVDAADGFFVAFDLKGVRARYDRVEVGAATMLTKPSANYYLRWEYAGGETALGLMPDGVLDVDGNRLDVPAVNAFMEAGGGGTGGGSATVDRAPTWPQGGFAKMAYVAFIGQSLSVGRASLYPADMMALFSGPVWPGHAFQFGAEGVRLLGSGTASKLAVRAGFDRTATMTDARELTQSGDGATEAWAFVDTLRARGLWADRAIVLCNTAIGGAKIEEARGLASPDGKIVSRMATNRRQAIIEAAQIARSKGAVPFAPAILRYDQDNANKTDSYATFYASLEGMFEDFRSDIAANGGDLSDTWLIVHAGAGVFGGSFIIRIFDVALALAKARANVICSMPGYLMESATGAYAYPAGTPGDGVHLSAIAKARQGVYDGIYFNHAHDGMKKLPLHINTADPTRATVTAGGLVTLKYENWRGTPLAGDTSFVTNPGGNKPLGYLFAPGNGEVPSPTIRPRASSFQTTGSDTLTFQLEYIATGLDAPPGANPWINIAGHHTGEQENGPDRGARACLRNDGSADTRTFATAGETYTIVPHDYAMPQRVALTLV